MIKIDPTSSTLFHYKELIKNFEELRKKYLKFSKFFNFEISINNLIQFITTVLSFFI